MDCNSEKNLSACNCTYEPCPRKGTCCDCIRYHLHMRQLPACAFDARSEGTFDRSFEYFASLVSKGRV
jgi:hypothetical protein